jgi:hypothetical protein
VHPVHLPERAATPPMEPTSRASPPECKPCHLTTPTPPPLHPRALPLACWPSPLVSSLELPPQQPLSSGTTVSPRRRSLRPVCGHKPVASELPLPSGLFPGQVRRAPRRNCGRAAAGHGQGPHCKAFNLSRGLDANQWYTCESEKSSRLPLAV